MLTRSSLQLGMRSVPMVAIAGVLWLSPPTAAQSAGPIMSDQTSQCTPGVRGYVGYSVITLPGLPYTATLKVTFERKEADGTTIRSVSRTVNARDSNGKARIANSMGCGRDQNGQSYDQVYVRIADRAAGTFLDWSPGPYAPKVAKLYNQPEAFRDPQLSLQWYDYERVQKITGQPTKTIRGESIGKKVIDGIEVQGRRITVTTPVGEDGNTEPIVVVHEWWISTELGVVMADMSDDPKRGHTEMELENFTRGEPDYSLFVPPDGYTVVQTYPKEAKSAQR